MKVYNWRSVENYVFGRLTALGYEIHQIPGSLCDNFICIAPDDRYYHILFREKCLNDWVSGLTKRRCRKLPKWAIEMLEEEALNLAREEEAWESKRDFGQSKTA